MNRTEGHSVVSCVVMGGKGWEAWRLLPGKFTYLEGNFGHPEQFTLLHIK